MNNHQMDEMNLDEHNWCRYLTFLLNNEEYAIEISRIREIRTWEKATFLPLAESFIKGVINMRGAIVPILDLRLRFGLKEVEPTQNTTIIIVQIESEEGSRLLGIIADQVLDIHDVEEKNIQTDSDINSRENNDCVVGMAKVDDKFLILLNQDKLLDL